MPHQVRRLGGWCRNSADPIPAHTGTVAVSTTAEATVVKRSDPMNSAKCSARQAPATISDRRCRAVGRTPARAANGSSATVPPAHRHHAIASAGATATRTRIAENDTASTPTTASHMAARVSSVTPTGVATSSGCSTSPGYTPRARRAPPRAFPRSALGR